MAPSPAFEGGVGERLSGPVLSEVEGVNPDQASRIHAGGPEGLT